MRSEPVSPEDVLPPNDLVFFLLDTVPLLDLSAFHNYYAGELRGQPPFDVTMMVTLIVYSYLPQVVPAISEGFSASGPRCVAHWP